jgi:hypothetical protein
MRRRTAVLVLAAVLAGPTACSDDPPPDRTTAGVRSGWYTAVDDALAARPEVTRVAQLETTGRCPLADSVPLAGGTLSDLSDHGVVRLDGTVPALLCSWYEDTVVDVEVAHAADAAGYAELVAGSHATTQPGNRQTERDVAVDGRTVRVVRIDYPTNPSAGTSLVAYLLDEEARGRVRLEVHRTQTLDGYDETTAATDLLTLVDH